MPVISAAVQPNRPSAVSARNVNLPSASLRQITSGRRLDEAAVVGLRRLDPLEEVGVRQGDRGMVGERLERRQPVGRDRARLAVADGERADDLAAGRAERGRGHRAEAHPRGDLEVALVARDARVGGVAGRPDDPALAGGEAVDAAVDRELLAAQPLAGLVVRCRPRAPSAAGRSGPRTSASGGRRPRTRTRRVSSTISPRIASASRIEVTRAAISRSVRSVSARRVVSSRERPSSRISSALWMAIVARSASAASSSPSRSPKRPISPEKTASVPRTTASPTIGAKAIERMPMRSKKSRWSAPSGKRASAP